MILHRAGLFASSLGRMLKRRVLGSSVACTFFAGLILPEHCGNRRACQRALAGGMRLAGHHVLKPDASMNRYRPFLITDRAW